MQNQVFIGDDLFKGEMVLDGWFEMQRKIKNAAISIKKNLEMKYWRVRLA